MKKWQKEEIQYLLENFGKIKARDIAQTLGRGLDAVHKKAQSLNLSGDQGINRKYSIDEQYFKTPNVENSYWAGFIAADGCVTGGYLKIMLQLSDLIILERFKTAIKYSGPIYIDKKRNRCSLEIHKKSIISDLYNIWSITERKSLTLEPPVQNLNNECFNSFVIGMIDGDGSIYFEKNSYLRISLLGTKNVLQWIQNRFGIHASLQKNGNIYKLRYSGECANAFVSKINPQKYTCLERKWEKVLTGYNPYDKIDVGAVTV